MVTGTQTETAKAWQVANHIDQVDSISRALSHKPGGYDGSLSWATHLKVSH